MDKIAKIHRFPVASSAEPDDRQAQYLRFMRDVEATRQRVIPEISHLANKALCLLPSEMLQKDRALIAVVEWLSNWLADEVCRKYGRSAEDKNDTLLRLLMGINEGDNHE